MLNSQESGFESTSAPRPDLNRMYLHEQQIAQLLERSSNFVTREDLHRFKEEFLKDIDTKLEVNQTEAAKTFARAEQLLIGIVIVLVAAIGGWIYSVMTIAKSEVPVKLFVITQSELSASTGHPAKEVPQALLKAQLPAPLMPETTRKTQ